MAFDNVNFPDYPLIHGLNKVITDPVQVSSNGTYEYRVKRSRWERYTWSVPTQTMTTAQKEEIRTFLSQRNHGLNSFKFIDPDYAAFDAAIMSHNSTDKWNLALPFDTNTPGDHPIFNPNVSALTVTVNGSPGVLGSASIIDGVPVIQVNGTTGTETIRITGQIDFTVRLNTDFKYALFALQCSDNRPAGHTVSAIELTEVFGEV